MAQTVGQLLIALRQRHSHQATHASESFRNIEEESSKGLALGRGVVGRRAHVEVGDGRRGHAAIADGRLGVKVRAPAADVHRTCPREQSR